MDYSQFLYMKRAVTDSSYPHPVCCRPVYLSGPKGATPKVNVRSLTLPAVILMTLHTVINLFPGTPAEGFRRNVSVHTDANHHQGSAQRRYHHRATDGP